jgi:putative tryptophan/tyrosine transport system substrate-binding protein
LPVLPARPLAARAQQSHRQARIGVLMNISADDPETLAQVGALSQGLSEAGWTIGRNVKIDYRWYPGNAEAARKCAAELVALEPDVNLASVTEGVAATQLATRTTAGRLRLFTIAGSELPPRP